MVVISALHMNVGGQEGGVDITVDNDKNRINNNNNIDSKQSIFSNIIDMLKPCFSLLYNNNDNNIKNKEGYNNNNKENNIELDQVVEVEGIGSDESDEDDNNNDNSNTVAFLHATPLTLYDLSNDPNGDLLTVDTLSIEGERLCLLDASKDAYDDNIHISFEHLNLLSLGMYLTVKPPTILHISCHGLKLDDGSYVMALEGHNGQTYLFTMDKLRRMLIVQDNHPELVVLSSCYSQIAAELFLKYGTNHVICCRSNVKVLDESAKCFTHFFYSALFKGKSIQRAFEIARINVDISFDSIVSDDMLESNKFILLPEHSINTNSSIIFSNKRNVKNNNNINVPSPIVRSDSGLLTHGGIPPLTDFTVGRQCEIQKVIGLLNRNRLIGIHGYAKYGKTTVAKAVCHWFLQRNTFESGVIWICMKRISNESDAIILLKDAVSRKLLEKNGYKLDNDTISLKDILVHISNWELLLCLDDCNSSVASKFIVDILQNTYATKILTTGIPLSIPIEAGLSYASIKVQKLPVDACKQLVYRLCPWLQLEEEHEERVMGLIQSCAQSPFHIRTRIRELRHLL